MMRMFTFCELNAEDFDDLMNLLETHGTLSMDDPGDRELMALAIEDWLAQGRPLGTEERGYETRPAKD